MYIGVIVSVYVAMIEASGIKIGASRATILGLWGQDLGFWGHNWGFRAKIRGFGAKLWGFWAMNWG